ncbi:MAG: S8 family peptidase, partial [Planctomycetota bacterium]
PLVSRQQSKRFIPNDPLFENQWHLQNTGQSGGLVGADANVVPAWDNFTGEGVLIGIVDDGLEHAHPDLDDRYSAEDSFDFNDDDPDPAPTAADPHGTSVAGVAAAVFENSLGVAGSAPDAGLSGLRLIAGPTSDLDEATALTFSMQNIDIYNNSWGPFDSGTSLGAPGPLTLQALEEGVTNGRGGLGSIHTWAGGNGRLSDDNVNYDAYANSRYTIAVAANSHNGTQSSYSEPGAPLLVTAPSNGDGVGIVTTDLLGNPGYNNGSGFSNDYTDSFGGTSSATPLVSGVIALMLEANPNLTWRDVQHILVQTAAQNDASDADWTTNGAGHLVNHKYGFGMVDAAAAVDAAVNWRTVQAETNYDSGQLDAGLAIPDNDAGGVTVSHTVEDDIIIEAVEIIFDATHTYRGNLEVVLVSPSGTESILAEERPDPNDNYPSWTFTSMRHWDESSLGEWTLTVRDLASSNTGTFNNWQLRFHGTNGIASLAIDVSPSSISENGGEAMATITRQFADLSEPLDVTLNNSDPSELILGAGNVTFEVGMDTVTVPVTAVDDNLLDGSQFVTLTATAEGLVEGIATVEVLDFETFDLQMSALSVGENGGTAELLIRRLDASSDAVLMLTSSRPDKLTFESETVVLPAGETQVTVTLIGVDNDLLDGDQLVEVTVESEHYVSASAELQVLDFEPLTLVVDETEISEKDGVVNAVLMRPDTSFPLTVQLDVTPSGTVTSPTVIEFPVGVGEFAFTFDAIDNSTLDGLRRVSVTATAPDHVDSELEITVFDHEELEFILPFDSVPENAGIVQAQLRRSDPNGDAVASLFSAVPFRVDIPLSATFVDGSELSEPFNITIRDNTLPDGDATVLLTANLLGFQLGVTELEVTDFEPLELVQLDTSVSESVGEVAFRLSRPSAVSDAVIALDGGLANFFEIPETVRIEAGSSDVTFVGTVIDNDIVTPNPAITLSASSNVYVGDSITFNIFDDDFPELSIEVDSDALIE